MGGYYWNKQAVHILQINLNKFIFSKGEQDKDIYM
jgi:hypothetical protein